MPKHAQACPIMFKHAQACPSMPEHAKVWPCIATVLHIYMYLKSIPVWMCIHIFQMCMSKILLGKQAQGSQCTMLPHCNDISLRNWPSGQSLGLTHVSHQHPEALRDRRHCMSTQTRQKRNAIKMLFGKLLGLNPWTNCLLSARCSTFQMCMSVVCL